MKENKKNVYFPIVGIGASAGGLSAFESFFSSLPLLDRDISFVLIQHLSPDSHSMLTEIIKRYTKMEVFEVKDNMKIEPKCVYIIPPNYDMKLLGYSFKLIKFSKNKIHKLPIDFFLESLAHELKENSVGIILSGTGEDGTQGIKAIKENGGLVFVQKTQTAMYDGMPQSALSTGLVDYELSIQEMAKNFVKYIQSSDLKVEKTIEHTNENDLDKIFLLLSQYTGHDFSMYKSNTMNRRIEKSMNQQKINSLKEYLQFLDNDHSEILKLFNELLIGVTNFFRDSDAFESLEKNAIPKLFIGKDNYSPIRVWVAACSTGEEAYSIAILLKEYMEQNKLHNKVQIFASDIDPKAIVTARNRVFPFSIEKNITIQRVKRFFHKNKDGYTIDKSIRDMIIFSEHNIIKDPPFSKLDLLSCRNLMIYMNAELQKNLILQFHYALYPSGVLFLGSSESIGELSDMFHFIDQKNKIFQCNYNMSKVNKIKPNRRVFMNILDKPSSPQANTLPLKDIMEQAVLKYLSPSAVLVEENGDILYLLGETSKYLQIQQGVCGVNNIFNMLSDEVKNSVLNSFNEVKQSKQSHVNKSLHVKINDSYEILNISISAVINSYSTKSMDFLYLIVFEDSKEIIEKNVNIQQIEHKKNSTLHESEMIKKLQDQLQKQETYLQDTNERLRLSNEELKSYNEEMQSMNEELQSTNEELETSREELQSLNEELSVVNCELETKVTDLMVVNNDMNNLVSGTGIGTIFVDHQLHILRFTPTIKQIINLIPGDVGRFLGDIVSSIISYKNLINDTQTVLDTLIPKEIEIEVDNGLWFLMRIQPYRTVENVIEGGVISFVDITEIVTIRQELAKVKAKKI